MISYAVLLGLAVLFNLSDKRMLALTLLVGVGIFFPVPDEYFYLVCVVGEAVIGIAAYLLRANASKVVWRLSILLIGFHVLGFVLNGYPQESPYHVLVRFCEHAELIACIVLSNVFIKQKGESCST